MASDGSVVLAGSTTGGYAEKNAGSDDFVVIKLDEYGKVLWTWQVRNRFARLSFCPVCVHELRFHRWLAVILYIMKVNQWSMISKLPLSSTRVSKCEIFIAVFSEEHAIIAVYACLLGRLCLMTAGRYRFFGHMAWASNWRRWLRGSGR